MPFLKQFVKYQSLGNDFIIFDWFKKPTAFIQEELKDAQWKAFVLKICDRHFGVGADGVLIITCCPQEGVPEVLIFNADGSNGQTCLNGLRCVAKHLFQAHKFPKEFSIKMSQRMIECVVEGKNAETLIKTSVGISEYLGEQTIETDAGTFFGYKVSIGNPHFIIFDKKPVEWLLQHGALIESHSAFPHRTNVEFVVPAGKNRYEVTVYERGCGVTLACSSGAAATMGLLEHLGHIKKGEEVALVMPGGTVIGCVQQGTGITLMADAQYVFCGSI